MLLIIYQNGCLLKYQLAIFLGFLLPCLNALIQTAIRSHNPFQSNGKSFILPPIGRFTTEMFTILHTFLCHRLIYLQSVQLLATKPCLKMHYQPFLTNNKKMTVYSIYTRLTASIEGHLKSRICSTDCVLCSPAFS